MYTDETTITRTEWMLHEWRIVCLLVCVCIVGYIYMQSIEIWVVVRPKRKYIHSLILPHSPFVGSFTFKCECIGAFYAYMRNVFICFVAWERENTLQQSKYTNGKWAPPPGHRLFISVYLLSAFIFLNERYICLV